MTTQSETAFRRDLVLYCLYSALTFALAWEGPFTWRFYVGIGAGVVAVLKAKLSPGKGEAVKTADEQDVK